MTLKNRECLNQTPSNIHLEVTDQTKSISHAGPAHTQRTQTRHKRIQRLSIPCCRSPWRLEKMFRTLWACLRARPPNQQSRSDRNLLRRKGFVRLYLPPQFSNFPGYGANVWPAVGVNREVAALYGERPPPVAVYEEKKTYRAKRQSTGPAKKW